MRGERIELGESNLLDRHSEDMSDSSRVVELDALSDLEGDKLLE